MKLMPILLETLNSDHTGWQPVRTLATVAEAEKLRTLLNGAHTMRIARPLLCADLWRVEYLSHPHSLYWKQFWSGPACEAQEALAAAELKGPARMEPVAAASPSLPQDAAADIQASAAPLFGGLLVLGGAGGLIYSLTMATTLNGVANLDGQHKQMVALIISGLAILCGLLIALLTGKTPRA